MFAKPLVEKNAALERLARRGTRFFARRKPKPEKIELIYFPYYLFRIVLSVEDKQREIFVAADGVLGEFAFMEMETLDFLEEADAHRFSFHIDMESAKESILDEYKWILVKHGFHRKNPPRMEAVTDTQQLYYPYWVAYYKKRKGYDFNAVDAVSLAPIGISIRRAFLAAFSQRHSHNKGRSNG